MENPLNKFDQLIKETYEGYEVPYNPAHWEELENELEIAAPNMSSYFGAVTTGLVAVSLVFLSMLFFFSDSSMDKNTRVAETHVTADGEGEPTGPNEQAAPDAGELADAGISKAGQTKLSEETTDTAEEAPEPESSSAASTGDKNAPSPRHSSNAKVTPPVANKQSVTASNELASKAKVRKGCTGLVINFNATEEYGEGAKYLWNFGDGYFSNEPNPTHTFNKEGVFDVSLSVTSKTTGQISSNVVQAMIEVIEAPVANLKIDITGPDQVELENDSYNATVLEWSVDEKPITDKSNIQLNLADNTRYNVGLNAMNEGGCTDTIEYMVNSIAAGSEFPRAMDLTSGHYFAPGTILDGGRVISLKVFNKTTGTLLFEGSGNQGWDGKSPKGEPVEKGSYKWVMAVKKPGSFDIYKGEIQVR